MISEKVCIERETGVSTLALTAGDASSEPADVDGLYRGSLDASPVTARQSKRWHS